MKKAYLTEIEKGLHVHVSTAGGASAILSEYSAEKFLTGATIVGASGCVPEVLLAKAAHGEEFHITSRYGLYV
jgi:hypothetical protein